MESDDQRNPQGARDRQGERAASAEMGVDQPRLQHCEIRFRGNVAELFEQQPVERATGAAPSE
jgi:hypothetical protein